MLYADSDYPSKAADRSPVSGGIFMCRGAAVCWSSSIQKCVTMSIKEAKYVALGDVIKELQLIRKVWRFIMLPEAGMGCVPVFEDNQGALWACKGSYHKLKLKRID